MILGLILLLAGVCAIAIVYGDNNTRVFLMAMMTIAIIAALIGCGASMPTKPDLPPVPMPPAGPVYMVPS